MSDQSFVDWYEKIARGIVAQPWLVEKFMVSSKYDVDTIWHIAKKYSLSYDRNTDIFGCDIFELGGSTKLKQNYVCRCCTKYLPTDVANIVVGFLWYR